MFIFKLIANGLAPLTVLGAFLAYWEPALFLPIGTVFLWLFAATMFALGVVLEPNDLQDTLRRPLSIAQGVLVQYTVMPLLGFAVAYFSGLPAPLALGFIIVGCAPGAMASNVIVYLAGGAVAFSIAMTTVATLLSPLLTPALVELLGSALLPIPFVAMMLTIVKTVLFPLLLGMFLRRVLGERLATAEALAPAVATIAIVLICSFAVAKNHDLIDGVGPLVLALVVAVNALGYGLGWLAGAWFGFDRRHKLTLAVEIGMQNAGLGVALALKHFSAETALPGALFAVWCIVTSAGAAAYFRRTAHRDAVLTP